MESLDEGSPNKVGCVCKYYFFASITFCKYYFYCFANMKTLLVGTSLIIAQVKEKVATLDQWLLKKEKLLPTFNDLRVRVEGSLALLLVRLGPIREVLDKRERIARSRLDLLDIVDPAPSRMRGFEVFRLYIVLLHRKMALLKSNSGKTRIITIFH